MCIMLDVALDCHTPHADFPAKMLLALMPPPRPPLPSLRVGGVSRQIHARDEREKKKKRRKDTKRGGRRVAPAARPSAPPSPSPSPRGALPLAGAAAATPPQRVCQTGGITAHGGETVLHPHVGHARNHSFREKPRVRILKGGSHTR